MRIPSMTDESLCLSTPYQPYCLVKYNELVQNINKGFCGTTGIQPSEV